MNGFLTRCFAVSKRLAKVELPAACWPALLFTFLLLLLLTASGAEAEAVCNASMPAAGNYTVTVCLYEPAADTTLAGNFAVTAGITFSGGNPGIARVVFSLDGAYLLTDYAPPYTFILPGASFGDGLHRLDVVAALRDGYVSGATGVDLTFANGQSGPPINGNTFTARTPTAAADRPLIVAATGDGAGGRAESGTITDEIARWDPDLFLYLGDVYEKGTYTEFYNWYGSSSTFFGRFRERTNPIVGNHEYENGSAPGYFNYWDNVPDYYSYDAAGWHFIALNSTSQLGETSPGTPQYDWLEADLAANPATCTIAYFHHPVYSVGPQGDTPSLNAVWQLLAAHGVDIVLVGHDHHYQRWLPLDGNGNPDPGGITQFVVGGGGHGVQAFVRGDPRLAQGFDTIPDGFGALRLELNAEGGAFRYINLYGTLLDSGVIPCSGSATDTTPPSIPATLVATLNSTGHVHLEWSAATDNVGVAAYTVYRDGAPLATVDGGITAYDDFTSELEQNYIYTVLTSDASGNSSAPSQPAPITTTAATRFVLTPVADGYVNQSNPGNKYGSSSLLRTDLVPELNSYLRFEIPPLNGLVVSATLRIYANSNSSSGYQLWTVTDNGWQESTLTYDTRPPLGAMLAASGPLVAGTWNTLEVSSLIQQEGALALALLASADTATSYSSREGAQPPALTIGLAASLPTATPAPLPSETPSPTPTPPPSETPSPTPTATLSPTITPVALSTGTFTFTASADTYVNESNPGSNYGSSTALRLDASPQIQSYLRFDLAGMGGNVASARLRLYANSSSSLGYSVHPVADSNWEENTLTFANAPLLGPAAASSGTLSAGTWTEVDITPLVNGNGPLSLALTTPSSTASSYGSRESGFTPLLIVTTVDPSAATATPAPSATPTTTPFPSPTPTATPSPTPSPTNTPVALATGTFTFTVSADGYVNENNPGGNYGNSTALRLDASPQIQSYLRFDLAGMGGNVASARLRLYANSSSSLGYSVHPVAASSWEENTLTFANAPLLGPAAASSGTVSAGMWTEVDVTTLVSGNGPLSLGLTTPSSTASSYGSRESGLVPLLIVTTVDSVP